MSERSGAPENATQSAAPVASSSSPPEASPPRGLLGLGWRFGRAAAERSELQARIRELERARDDLRVRLVRLEQEHAAALQDAEQHAAEQERLSSERDEWRSRTEEAEGRETELRERTLELESRAEVSAQLAAQMQERLVELEPRAGALAAVTEVVRESIAELREEGRRLRSRPGMWSTGMIATFCTYTAGKLERSLEAALPADLDPAPAEPSGASVGTSGAEAVAE